VPKLLVLGDSRSIHTRRWCDYFVAQGCEMALFSLEPAETSFPFRYYQGKRPTSIAAIDYPLARRDYRKALGDFRPDVVNAHYVTTYGWLASLYTGRGRPPVIVTAWGSDLLRSASGSMLYERRAKRALRRAAYCTVDGDNLYAAAARYTDPDKIVRVVLGLEREIFNRIAKDDFPKTGPLRIIAPRGLAPVYNPHTVIEAVGIVKDRFDTHVDLLGEGPWKNDITLEIGARSLYDRIDLKPFLPHADYLQSLRQYDVFLSASLSDSTAVSLLEAMAAGLLPVVSDIDGNREWIENGRNGLLFQPQSASSLADALTQAEKMRPRLPDISAENRRRIETDAIWEDNMERVNRLILELTER